MLKVNVGVCRKVGEPDYGSRGANVNVEVELDSALANDSERLRMHIRELFDLARVSVNEELGQPRSSPLQRDHQANGQSNEDANYGTSSRRSSGNGRRATESQVKAIFAISKRSRIDLTGLLRDRFNVSRPDDLSLQEASRVIDELKGAAGQENRR